MKRKRADSPDGRDAKSARILSRYFDETGALKPDYVVKPRIQAREYSSKMPILCRHFFRACATGDVARVAELLAEDPSLVNYVSPAEGRHVAVSALYVALESSPLLSAEGGPITVPAYLLSYVCSNGNVDAEGKPRGAITEAGLENARALLERVFVDVFCRLGSQDRTSQQKGALTQEEKSSEVKVKCVPSFWVLQQLKLLPEFCTTILRVDAGSLPATPRDCPAAIPEAVRLKGNCGTTFSRAKAFGYNLQGRTKEGKSALFVACEVNLKLSFRFFLKDLSDDDGLRDLYIALKEDNQVVLANLAALDITKYSAVNQEGKHVLHLACEEGNAALFAALVEDGPSPFQRDNEGRTPHTLAVSSGFEEALRYYRTFMYNFAPLGREYISPSGVLQQAAFLSALEAEAPAAFDRSATRGFATLLQHGHSPFTQDLKGDSAFYIACVYGNDIVWSKLMDYCRKLPQDTSEYALFQEALCQILLHLPIRYEIAVFRRLKKEGVLEEVFKNKTLIDELLKAPTRRVEHLLLAHMEEDGRYTHKFSASFFSSHPYLAYLLLKCGPKGAWVNRLCKIPRFIKSVFEGAMAQDDIEMMLTQATNLVNLRPGMLPIYCTVRITLLEVAQRGSILATGVFVVKLWREDEVWLKEELAELVDYLLSTKTQQSTDLLQLLLKLTENAPSIAVIITDKLGSDESVGLTEQNSTALKARVFELMMKRYGELRLPGLIPLAAPVANDPPPITLHIDDFSYNPDDLVSMDIPAVSSPSYRMADWGLFGGVSANSSLAESLFIEGEINRDDENNEMGMLSY